jgi:hypothetical protein
VGLCLVLLSSFAWALPTEQQIQDEVKAGRYTQAESMMSDVVSAKPNSAKAHYLYAELLAHNGNFNKAAEETARARQIDPSLTFTDPSKFKAFESTLQREQSAPVRSRAAPTSYQAPSSSGMSSGGGIPGWVWVVGLIVVAMVLWRGFARSRAQSMGALAPAGFNGGYGPGQAGTGYGPGPYGPGGAPMGGGAGSGLLGTGLAVGAGIAGGMLLDRALHNNGNEGNVNNGGFLGGGDSYAGNPAAQELQDRPIDFGNGNDWDSGGGGGGVDFGGGGGDSGGGSWD